MDGHRVGGDVDAYCTKCRMLLGHTVLAMVGDKIARVRCNTCMGEHAFRPNPPGTKAPKAEARPRAAGGGSAAPRARATREKAEVRPFEEIFADRDTSEARPYVPKERFEDGDMISHPTFGLGLVRTARQDKIDVVFKVGEKVLVHNLAGARNPVSFARPARREGGPEIAADKPPPGESTGLHAIQSVPLTEIPEADEPAAD